MTSALIDSAVQIVTGFCEQLATLFLHFLISIKAFDIDGVLLGNDSILRKGKQAMAYVRGNNPQRQRYPFVLLTNGGGITDRDRLRPLSERLELQEPLRERDLIQSHTPMLSHCEPYRDKPVFVVGGRDGKGRQVARSLGFSKIHTHDEFHDNRPDMWPFRASVPAKPKSSLDVEGIPFGMVLVVHDSIDWGCDIQIMIDILSSYDGRIDSPKDVDDPLQWTADRQVPLFFSNGDILFANAFPRPRLGQGGFRTAFAATYKAATGHDVHYKTFGKPTTETYSYALDRLQREAADQGAQVSNIYMVGDNPESDIAGANAAGWQSILVRGGVFQDKGPPAHKPTIILDDSFAAVQWAIEQERHRMEHK